MKIEVTISKRHMFAFVFILVAFAGLFFAYAYNSNPPNPPVFGHSPSEIGPGTFFNSTANDQYIFPGKVGIGAVNPGGSGAELGVRDTTGGDTGVYLATVDGKNAYIDFIEGTTAKSNIYFDGASDLLRIGDKGYSTVIGSSGATGHVGIGKTPLSAYKLDVAGTVNANTYCQGTQCRSLGMYSTSPALDNQFTRSLAIGGTSTSNTTILGYKAPFSDFDHPNSYGFCALLQTETSGWGGCQISINSGTNNWELTAYRANTNVYVFCRANCIGN